MDIQSFSDMHAGPKASPARAFRNTDGTEIVFLQDLSDSFANDLPSMRNSIDEVIERLKIDFSTHASHFPLYLMAAFIRP